MAKKRIDRKKNSEDGTVVFTEVATNDSLTCNAADLFPDYAKFNDVQKQTVLHAINAKCGDSAADPTNPAIPQIENTWKNLLDGTWAERSTGEGSTRLTDFDAAMATVMTAGGNDVTAKDIAAARETWSEEKFESYKIDPRVVAEVKKIQAQRARERARDADKKAKDTELPELSL